MLCGLLFGFLSCILPEYVIIREPSPHSYFERIRPGDVGYIREGCFHLLFSAGCPLDERELGVHVPRNFTELKVGKVFNRQPREPGFLATKNVQATRARPTPRTPPSPTSSVPYVYSIISVSTSTSEVCPRILEPGCNISFQLSGGQGAALVTKYQTLREDVQRAGTFEKYTKEHYDSWVEFASATGHGENINPVLVTGVDRTRDFAMMSYSNDDDDNDLRSEFITSVSWDFSTSAWGTWYTRGFVHTNCGPHPYVSPSFTQTADSTASGSNAESISDEYNQCVFVRYYTMRKRLGIPKIIKAGAGPHDLGPGSREDSGSPKVEARSPSDSGSDFMSSLCDYDGGNDMSSVTSIESESDIVIHNTPAVRSLQTLSACSRPF